MNKSRIVVVGSTNTDMVIKAHHLPVPGETILGGSFFMNPGGKGANQVVAVARLGGNAIFIAKIGKDVFGRQSVELLQKEGINTQYIFEDKDQPSGVALITVDEQAENCIVVAPGANATLNKEDIDCAASEIEKADWILTQLETPLETIEYVAEIADRKGVKVILNPAPASLLPADLLKKLYMITPNETEAGMIAGVKVTDVASAKSAAQIIHQKGVDIVVITLGSAGALVYENGHFELVDSVKVSAVDTTAAGDTFNGALAVALSEGRSVLDSVRFATQAAAISVTRLGAQASIPFRSEIK
ncbi:MAG: ribokinase [Bacteroidales bacterium]|nr:ribokinase [Bacteroidales bacterium]